MASFMHHLGECWRCANLYRAAQLEKLDVGCYQYTYLLTVCKNPGIAQESIAGLVYIHKSNVARQLASLEEKGLIERRADEADKRNLLVYPTEKAYAILPEVERVLSEWDEFLLDAFDEEERELLESLSSRLAARAKQAVAELGGKQ